jgi:hypothetical protein
MDQRKQAVKMPRLSCHRFRSNEVRLWLSVLACNLGNLWRRLVLPKRLDNWSLTSLQQRLVKTGGRLIKHARLLAAAGGEPSHAAVVRGDGTADRSAARARRIGRSGAGNRATEGGDGQVSEKPLETSHFRFLPYSQAPKLVPSGAARAAQKGKARRTAATEAAGCTIDGGQEAIMEILVHRSGIMVSYGTLTRGT